MSTKKQSEVELVRRNWERFQNAKVRGHQEYINVARLNEDFYLGGGLQWSDDDRSYLENLGRPVVESNQVFPAINTAKGMQLKSRVDISFKPRGAGADEATAEVLAKVIAQICDDIKYQWRESLQFEDGIIQQRGFLDFRIEFDESMKGDIECRNLDPMDVLPDPDAQDYEPDNWQDVIIMRWLSIDDIQELYGKKKALEVEQMYGNEGIAGDQEDYIDRSRFGESTVATGYDSGFTVENGLKRVLVLDRQWRKLEMQKVLSNPVTGQIEPVEGLSPEQINGMKLDGGIITKRMTRRIRWTVSTDDCLLHDDWSPYKTFTVIPYFPYFRRGRTRGMVDNLRSPQELLNKNLSMFQHIGAGIANTGYWVEQGSLTNMETSDLATVGSKTGFVGEYAKGSNPPTRIEPPQMPQNIDRMIERTEFAIKTVSGMSDAMQGLNGNEISGVALQSKQYQGQAQLGGPLDNLSCTRHSVALKMLELVQGFYTEQRLIMITDRSDIANEQNVPVVINEETPEGRILNDLTVGEYDVVVTDQPTADTYMDNQFQQAMEMRDKGIAIPDNSVIEMSSLSKKHEIAQAMAEQAEPAPDPNAEAEAEEKLASAELKRAQAGKAMADTVGSSVDSQYSAMQAAGVITGDPATAPLADQLLRSAGYKDQDMPPIVPEYGGPPAIPQELPPNTDPTTPVPVPAPAPDGIEGEEGLEPSSPAVGASAGIETQRLMD